MGKIHLDDFEMNFQVEEDLLPTDTLFIHGNLASNTWWEPAVNEWRSRGARESTGRALLGEWRGCGATSAPRSNHDLHPSKLASDYIQALRLLRVQKADLVAHSTGGLIALYALLQAPELFGSVVLLDSVGAHGASFPPEALAAFTRMSQDREYCKLIMGGTIYEPVSKRAGQTASEHVFAKLFEQIVDDAFHVAKENWQGVPAVLSDINIASELGRIQHRTLVLHGEHDAILPIGGSSELAALLPNASFELLRARGHSTNVEDPERFVRLVSEFLIGSHNQRSAHI